MNNNDFKSLNIKLNRSLNLLLNLFTSNKLRRKHLKKYLYFIDLVIKKSNNKDIKSYVYILKMLIVCLNDLTKFKESYNHLKKTNKEDYNKTIEELWDLFCDAKERSEYLTSIKHDIVFIIKDILEDIEHNFLECFGEPMFMSPVILVKEYICSICNIDIDECKHIPGHIYAGEPCIMIASKIEDILSVDIVKNPSNPRCRIWSWNYNKEENTFVTKILESRTIHDFTI